MGPYVLWLYLEYYGMPVDEPHDVGLLGAGRHGVLGKLALLISKR